MFLVRAQVREPERWEAKAEKPQFAERNVNWAAFGSCWEVLGIGARYSGALAAVGLATFWGVMVAGKELSIKNCCALALRRSRAEKAKFAYGFVQTPGLVWVCFFGPIAHGSVGGRTSLSFMCWRLSSCR